MRPGDAVVIMPSGRTSRVVRILTADGDLGEAVAGQVVTVTLADAVDVRRGDVIADVSSAPECADQFVAHIVWMGESPMLPKRQYLVQVGHQVVTGQVRELRHRINVNSLEPEVAGRLEPNEVGVGIVALDEVVAFDGTSTSRSTGTFVMIDRRTNATVAGGVIATGSASTPNVTWQRFTVTKTARAAAKGQTPCVIWFTGLSGAGKSTIANLVEAWLTVHGHHTYLLDGDNLRHRLNRDLGFTDEDRVENVRRVAEIARLMTDVGLIVLASLISPFRVDRLMARDIVGDDAFVEVYVDTPLAVCERRDPKRLYQRARAGEIRNFTGIGSAYEPPSNPDLTLDGAHTPPEALAQQVVALLRRRGIVEC